MGFAAWSEDERAASIAALTTADAPAERRHCFRELACDTGPACACDCAPCTATRRAPTIGARDAAAVLAALAAEAISDDDETQGSAHAGEAERRPPHKRRDDLR